MINGDTILTWDEICEFLMGQGFRPGSGPFKYEMYRRYLKIDHLDDHYLERPDWSGDRKDSYTEEEVHQAMALVNVRIAHGTEAFWQQVEEDFEKDEDSGNYYPRLHKVSSDPYATRDKEPARSTVSSSF